MELPPHVLRYWETEFEELKPKKNRAGNRVYNQGDLRIIERIKYLLKEARYTLEGAKRVMDRNEPESEGDLNFKLELREIRDFLADLLEKLENS